jgi:hypothetical protein
MLPYRKAAELLAEFLPIEASEGHVSARKRTLTVGARLEKQSLRRELDNPPMTCERKQLELSIRTIRCESSLSASIRPMCDAPIQRRRAISKLS